MDYKPSMLVRYGLVDTGNRYSMLDSYVLTRYGLAATRMHAYYDCRACQSGWITCLPCII